MTKKELADKFYMARVSKRLTMRQVASIAEISPSTLSRLERAGNARFDVVVKVACALGVPLSELEKKDTRGGIE